MLMVQLMQLEDLDLNLVPKILKIINKLHKTTITTIVNGFPFTRKQRIDKQIYA